MANVPRVSTNTSTAAVARAGRISGSVIVRSTVTAPAPAARAARSSAGSARAARPTAATSVGHRYGVDRDDRGHSGGTGDAVPAEPEQVVGEAGPAVRSQPAVGEHEVRHHDRQQHPDTQQCAAGQVRTSEGERKGGSDRNGEHSDGEREQERVRDRLPQSRPGQDVAQLTGAFPVRSPDHHRQWQQHDQDGGDPHEEGDGQRQVAESRSACGAASHRRASGTSPGVHPCRWRARPSQGRRPGHPPASLGPPLRSASGTSRTPRSAPGPSRWRRRR